MIGWIPLFAAVCGFAVTAVIGTVLVPFLKKINFGQTILDIGPKWHKSKEGTPIMGGFMFIIGSIVAIALSYALASFLPGADRILRETADSGRMVRLIAGVLMALCMAMIGFADDYIKAVKKQNLGLSAKQKTFLQLLIAAVYLATLSFSGMTYTYLPFLGKVDIMHGFGLIFWPIALIFIYGFTNAVNLTDGVDGLATSVTFVVCLFFMISSGMLAYYGMNALSAAMAGACAGFLIWNIHPAKVFMGDTGSMYLGGMVVAFAFGIDRPVLLILAGVLYLLEALSDIIQIFHYKRTKKRLFKMAPIHHHFEMSGWSENKIVLSFSAVSVVGCILAFLLILFA